MVETCVCGIGGGNTGKPNCFGIFDVAKRYVFVEYYKSDGSINGIELDSLTDGVLDQDFWDEKLQNLDSTLRYYPTPELKNVLNERAEDIVESYEDGTASFIQDGVRTSTSLIIKGEPVLLGNLKQWKCQTMGYFEIDKSGNFIGNTDTTGYIHPIRVQDESFAVMLIRGTDTTKQKIQISFIVSQLEDDAQLGMITADQITANLSTGGLVDVYASEISNITTTGFDVQLNTEFGGITSEIPAEGLEVDDFSSYNVTQSTTNTLTSVTESAVTPGLYSFVYDAVTAADSLLNGNKTTGNLDKGYDITSFTVATP